MRLKFDARARAILKRLPVVNVYSVLELLLLAGLAVQCARLVWTVLTPVSPLGDWRPAGPVIPSAPAAVLRGFDPFFRISGTQSGPAVVTSLQLKLFGTRIDEATGQGSAIVAGPDGVQQSIAVGEEIIPGVVLKEVAFDHVAIERGGVREDLFLDQSGGAAAVTAAPAPGGAAPAPGAPSPAGGAGVTVQQLQSDVGFIPRIDSGRISGLVVRAQGSGAAFRAAGLKDGDIVTAIGGRPVTGPADIDRLSSDFAGGGNLSLTVERGGQTLPIAVQMAAPK
ncbi:PDZ domain-containing protein [Sphingomonas sp. SUN019]|uniref:type II secretion system protein N n=1 Tax=Sphingomonas sp. SUN019 TaxID=2937788 RepID=UPI00216479C5|nr:type II secretion system protein N [Sphingomonas sp. SUN019]UVO49384.1 PDZ domain-containing protein [Sphingomonas sp. SUN019]